MYKTNLVLASSLIALLLVGCGGAGGFEPTRGEGSIPIGRAQTTDSKAVSVLLRTGGSSYQLSVSGGTVYAPSSLLAEPYNVAISAPDGYEESFDLAPASDPADAFDVVILPKTRASDVSEVTLENAEIVLRVGDSLKLKTKVYGSNVNGLSPSYWATAGLASVTRGGVLKAKSVGSGTVTVDVLGKRATMPFTILP